MKSFNLAEQSTICYAVWQLVWSGDLGEFMRSIRETSILNKSQELHSIVTIKHNVVTSIGFARTTELEHKFLQACQKAVENFTEIPSDDLAKVLRDGFCEFPNGLVSIHTYEE